MGTARLCAAEAVANAKPMFYVNYFVNGIIYQKDQKCELQTEDDAFKDPTTSTSTGCLSGTVWKSSWQCRHGRFFNIGSESS